MSTPDADPAAALTACFREEWPALVSAAARITGDLASAEEIVQDVLVAALARWPFSGIPDRPGAWLLTATRNRARNHLRDTGRAHARELTAASAGPPEEGTARAEPIEDDRLRLIFMCCHPTLTTEAKVALTLRLVCGLSVRQIGRAFLTSEAAIGQRITRAKRVLADSRVSFEAPPPGEWPERLPAVLAVVYLVFNEGYAPSDGPSPVGDELCEDALRIGRLLAALLPDQSEAHGLVALMELHTSRRATRTDDHGDLVLLEDQDRSRWDRRHIEAGITALGRARALGERGPLTLQAELAACHTLAPSWAATDWAGIADLYEQLMARSPSPVVALNRAVAVAMLRGPQAGLDELSPLIAGGALDGYHLLWAARADLLRRLGRLDQAAVDYRRALELATNLAERRFLAGRLGQCRPDEAS